MTRKELCSLRDELFATMLDPTRRKLDLSAWSLEDRMRLTMQHLQYQAVVTQLAQLERDYWYTESIVHLDQARGALLDARDHHGDPQQLVLDALVGVTAAMTALES